MARIILSLFPNNSYVEDGKPHHHFPHLEDGDSHPSRALCGSLHQDVRVVHAPEQPERVFSTYNIHSDGGGVLRKGVI